METTIPQRVFSGVSILAPVSNSKGGENLLIINSLSGGDKGAVNIN